VRAELAVIAAQIDQQQPGRETAINVRQATFLAFPDARAPLFSIAAIVMVGFSLVLLIACANVANLLLARAAGRTKEIAVRLSVGATRGRLLRQLLTESLLIAMAGGAIGAALAAEASQTLVDFALRSLPAEIPFNVDTSPDLRVLGFAFGITCLTGIAFGLMPALQASKPDLQSALKQDDAVCGRSTVGWLRGGLVTVQVAVCMTLMVAAGLLMRGLYAAQTVEPGFNYHDIALVSMDLEGSGYSVPDGAVFHERLMDEIRPLPGIEAVAQASVTPLGQNRRGTVVWPDGQENAQRVYMNEVSPGYLQVLEIPIVRGRDFTPAEVTDSPSSVIVTQSTSRRFWPGENPLTKTMEIGVGRGERRVLQVVGVAADTQVLQIGEDDTPFIYLPAGPQTQLRSMILARTTADFAAVAAAIRKRAEEMDSGLVVNVNRLEENLEIWRSLSRLAAVLSGSMGALALLLASIGVYGVVAYAVSRRLREVGIRMALGASGRDVMSMLLRQAMTPVLVGAVIGVLACAAVSHILSSALFGVSPLDPIVFVVAPACLIAVAVLASVIPARLVMRVDPVNTLRYE
jgi:predicted permease